MKLIHGVLINFANKIHKNLLSVYGAMCIRRVKLQLYKLCSLKAFKSSLKSTMHNYPRMHTRHYNVRIQYTRYLTFSLVSISIKNDC